jgi:hypothetical protein
MKNLYYKYLYDFTERLDIIMLAAKYNKILNNNLNQTGGTIQIFESEGYKFKIDISRGEDIIIINLLQYDTDHPSCVTILINSEGIGVYPNCAFPPFRETRGAGSLLLRFILKFVRHNKERLKIKRLELRNDSTKACLNCPHRIKLIYMYTLLYGETWYGKYGFRPFLVRGIEGELKYLLEQYENNKRIMNIVLTREVPLFDLFIESTEQLKLSINKENLKKYLDKNRDKLLEFLTRYDKFCCIFQHMALKIMNRLNLYNFDQHSFYLDL